MIPKRLGRSEPSRVCSSVAREYHGNRQVTCVNGHCTDGCCSVCRVRLRRRRRNRRQLQLYEVLKRMPQTT
ncbi:hypothetical protein LSAT2_017394 [Lamellibrachia satsuma]|nr:hypothetical protein LSAT2_017394 [Lamellibrachia satsuma]